MKFDFNRYKYDRELFIDCIRLPLTKDFRVGEEPYFVTFHEMIFITKGTGTFRLDDEEIPFQPGTILLMPPNKWRHWVDFSEVPDGYLLIFEEEFISTFFNDALFLFRFHFFYNANSPSYVQIAPDLYEELLKHLVHIREELKGLGEDSHHFLRASLYLLLIHINRSYVRQFELQGQFFEDNLTLNFRRLLEQHIRTHHQVGEYADLLQVSKSHLNKTLKRQFGRSSSEIIKERLLAEIKRELLYSSASIAEISYQLNFSEPSNFHRFFKEMMQLTPKEYRRQNAN